MELSIVVLSMRLLGGGAGAGGCDAGSQTKERRDKKVGIKSESSLIKCAIRKIRTADLSCQEREKKRENNGVINSCPVHAFARWGSGRGWG